MTFLWLAAGLVILFSASYATAATKQGDGLYYIYRQLFWIAMGLVGFQVLVHSSLRQILNLSPRFFLVLLGLILVTGLLSDKDAAGGATRWLYLGPFQIQPSELIKPFLIVQGASLFGQWHRLPWSKRIFWLGIFAIMLLGILRQPNLSTTALCGMSLWLMALAAGIPYTYLGASALGGLVLGVLSIAINKYQRLRIISFLNPWADPKDTGYQLTNSLMAVGSGQLWGKGYGNSMQKLFYLPIQDTDFIFAVFAEEFGFVGCFLLMAMLAAYGTLAFKVAQKTDHPVYRLVVIGAMLLLVGQALLNIGVNIGALPTTGLPFPFFSYGGSSMIASLMIAGLLIRVARESGQGEVVQLRPS
jgi:cell division protein FtsW